MDDMKCFAGLEHTSDEFIDEQCHYDYTRRLFDISRNDPLLMKLDRQLLCQYIHSRNPRLYPFPWYEDAKGLRLLVIAVDVKAQEDDYKALDIPLMSDKIVGETRGVINQGAIEFLIRIQWEHVPHLLSEVMPCEIVLNISDTTLECSYNLQRIHQEDYSSDDDDTEDNEDNDQ